MTNIDDLPEEIIDIINSNISPTTLVWLNKSNYIKYNYIIKSMIHTSRFEDYIRDMVRNNNVFVLKHIIVENINRWVKMKRWRYKNIIYYDYIHFIFNYAIENNAYKSRELIDKVATQVFGVKWHKKNGIKYIRTKWMN